MQKWEYARLVWSEGEVGLQPAEKFDAKSLKAWLEQNFPQCRAAEIEEPRPTRQAKPVSYRIRKLGGFDHAVGMALLEQLGLDGWEASMSVRHLDSGTAIFDVFLKRPIPDTDTEGSES